MIEQERKEKAKRLFEEIEEVVSNAYERWLDEKEYEDINDYAILFQSKVEAIGGQFIRMTKRPFGFIYTLDEATYQVSINNTRYKYVRIK